jgi:6-phosphogluconate dehydrogenase
MGENLVLNMANHGFKVAVFNRTVEKVHSFVGGRGKRPEIIGTETLPELISVLKKPRKVMLMVKAGAPVDQFIDLIAPHLEAGDILIDGGNSFYEDTARREKKLQERGLLYVGTGVSGGEIGALTGPSLMPGGAAEAWPHLKNIFQTIAAQVDGTPCCDWIGPGSSGHFTKMVHNGIEYGDMQLIGEVYHILRNLLGMTPPEMASIFREWNQGRLGSYLIEITADILTYKDEDGSYLVDKILDTTGQKGTGKWTGMAALELGVPLTLITESVFARSTSSLKEERLKASAVYPATSPAGAALSDRQKAEMVRHLEKALYAAKIVSYAQGFTLLRAMSQKSDWQLNYGQIALMWRGGCIIRSVFLGSIAEAFARDAALENLLLDPFFSSQIKEAEESWRQVVGTAVTHGIPVPSLSAALAYFDSYRSAALPANLLQAQRDYFGAHTYERIDAERGRFFHTNWTGMGGETASTTYQA